MSTNTERPRARNLNPLRALLPFLKPYRGMLVAALGALLVATIAMLALPLALRQLIDHVVAAKDSGTLNGYLFGFLAASLASIGLYGVMAYIVARRRGEIGIRIALGADRAEVLKLIGGECGKLVLAGLVIGIGFALAASQAITKLLYGLSPTDPLTIGLSVLLLALVALPASLIPAIRASRLDPMKALREE